MDTQISRLTEFDEHLIRHLFEKAGVEHSEPNPQFFEDEKNVMLVARTDGILSGFLWAYILLCPDRSTPKLHLYSIDTFEPLRRQGIATLLIRHLKEIARAHNCYKMILTTGKDNLPAISLYRSTGGIPDVEGLPFEYDREALDS